MAYVTFSKVGTQKSLKMKNFDYSYSPYACLEVLLLHYTEKFGVVKSLSSIPGKIA